MSTTLVSTDTLARHLDDPGWAIVDCRFVLTDPPAGRRAYAYGHIPGAHYADLNADLSAPVTSASGRHPLPDPQQLAVRLGAWGIAPGTQVVVYDDSFGAIAVRLWWLLRWCGHGAVALLDGGLPKWRREHRPITTVVPQPAAARFVARPDDGRWVDSTFVEGILGRHDYRLFDARAEERYIGLVEPLDPVPGHVPGARNAPFEDNLDVSGVFLPPAELRERYTALLAGAAPSRAIHMCGSGVTACHNILAMELAGLSGARLYAGSWSEWIRDRRRPISQEV